MAIFGKKIPEMARDGDMLSRHDGLTS